MRKLIASMIVCLLGLSGCGTVAHNADVGVLHVANRPTIEDNSTVAIVADGPPLSAATERVSGTSCKNKIWDPAPSEANAIALMKREAEAKGYNAVHSVKVINDPAAVIKNCWTALIATGIAFRTQ